MQPPQRPALSQSPAPRPSWWSRYRNASRPFRVGIGCGGLVALGILFAVVGAVFSQGGADSTSRQHPTATSSRVAQAPTATAIPTIKEDAAVLGGAVYAFTKKFGNSGLGGYRNGWNYQGPYGEVWAGVWYAGYTGGAIDESAKDRVTTIVSDASQDTTANWTVSQADGICNLFLPPDAQYKGTITVTDVAGVVTGTEKRYTSPLLANTLPASDFMDVNGHAVAPGTFYMDYMAQYNGSSVMLVGSCTLSTDESVAQTL